MYTKTNLSNIKTTKLFKSLNKQKIRKNLLKTVKTQQKTLNTWNEIEENIVVVVFIWDR